MNARSRWTVFRMLIGFVLGVSSAHAGLGFSTPIAIEKGAANDDVLDGGPRLETGGSGTWIASWHKGDLKVETDVVVSRSIDNGATWSEPTALNADPDTDSVADYSIRTATDGAGNWVAIWVVDLGFANNVADASILVSRSNDDGASWAPPQVLSTQADIYSTFALLFAAGTPLPWLTTDKEGNWLAAWRASVPANASGDIDILTSLSTDNGATWSDPVNVSPANDDRDDGGPRIAATGTGRWMVLWNYWGFLVSEGLVTARSNDNGQTWGPPKTIIEYAAGDNVRHNISRLDSDGAGHWIAVGDFAEWDFGGPIPVYTDDSDIFIIRSYDNGKTWTQPVPLNPDAGADHRNDAAPVLTTDGAGNWLVAWSSGDLAKRAPDAEVSACYSGDNGVMWSRVVPLNANAPVDRGNDLFPGIKTDGAGTWVAVWSSNNVLPGNTNDGDTDIHAATSTFTSGDNLIVLSPDGGERVKAGKRLTIDWLSIGDTGPRVNIDLLRNGALVSAIKASAVNDGSFVWRVPPETETGKGYKVRVESVSNASIDDASDLRFKVIAQ